MAKHVIILMSFGYETSSVRPEAHMSIDARPLLRPGRTHRLRELTGLDKEVQDFVAHQDMAAEMLDMLVDWVRHTNSTHFRSQDELRIAIGCKSGRHRSVAMVEALAVRLRGVVSGSVAIRKEHQQLDPELSQE